MNAVISIADVIAEKRRRGLPLAEEAEAAQEEALPSALALAELGPPEPIAWAVRELIVAGELGMFAGPGGALKTTAALAVAVAVAGGGNVFDRFACDPGPVMVVSAEDGQGVLINHFAALTAGANLDPELVRSRIHLIAVSGVDLTSSTWQDHLTREVERIRPRILMFDPLGELLGGISENDASELRAVIRFLRGLAAQFGCAVLLLHHYNKPREGQGATDRVRGSSSINTAMRSIFAFESASGGCRVTCTKLSRAMRPAPFTLALMVDTDPENPATWRRATLQFDGTRTVEAATAQEHVLATLQRDGRLSTTNLKARRGPFRPLDVTAAIRTLEAEGRIDWVPGPFGSHLWGIPEQVRVPF